jgi:hypothetical protein
MSRARGKKLAAAKRCEYQHGDIKLPLSVVRGRSDEHGRCLLDGIDTIDGKWYCPVHLYDLTDVGDYLPSKRPD